jgi:stalled ribosome rescue protein Dom34
MKLDDVETAALERVLNSHYHAVVWIDHHEARVIFFNADDADEKTIHPEHHSRHSRHKSGSPAGTHERGEATYYRGVADALGKAKAFLVAGPSTAKTEFVTWLRSEAPAMIERLSGIETLQHMTDGQLVAEARRFFKGADHMKPQIA